MKALLEAAGMQVRAAYDAFTKDQPSEKSERIYVIASKGQQERCE